MIIHKPSFVVDDETGATFWPTNAGAAFNATNARFRVADVDLAALYASSDNRYKLVAKDTAGKKVEGFIDVADEAEALGSELCPDPTCTTDFFDSAGVGWTHDADNDEYDSDGSQAASSDLKETMVTIGKLYKIVFEVKNYSAGAIQVFPGGDGNTNATWRTANETYTEYLVCMGNTELYVRANLDFVGSVDNISVKEVTNVGTDGVLIMSTKGGSTQSWASQESGVDLNDIATFEVQRATRHHSL